MKYYACPYCNKQFTRKYNSDRHKKICFAIKQDQKMDKMEQMMEQMMKNQQNQQNQSVPTTINNYNIIKDLQVKLQKPDLIEKTEKTGKKKSGYVYLIQTKASIALDESVYKIGKTTQTWKMREAGYDKGGNVIYIRPVKDCHHCEKHLKIRFNEIFEQRKDYGVEYFKGDVHQMVDAFESVISILNTTKSEKGHTKDSDDHCVLEKPIKDSDDEIGYYY